MITTSQAYKDYIAESSVLSFEIRFKINGSADTYSIYPEDCKDGTFKLVDELCPPGEFSVGNTIATHFEVDLVHGLDRTLNLDFTGVKLFFGIPDENNHPTEAFQRGEYTIDKKYIFGKQMKLVGYDHFADVTYNSANINGTHIPSGRYWKTILTSMGFDVADSWGQTDSVDGVYSPELYINAEYGLKNITKRDMAGLIAKMFACNLKYDNTGKLKRVYFPTISDVENLEGSLVGTAIVGQALVGNDYSLSALMVRPSKMIEPAEVLDNTSLASYVWVKSLDGTEQEDSFVYLDVPAWHYGDGIAFGMSDNPFNRDATMDGHTLNEWLDKLWGTFYTPFTINIMGDPSWEAGDLIRGIDGDDNAFYTPILSYEYNLGGISVLSCNVDGEASAVNQIYANDFDTSRVEKGETLTSMPFYGYGYVSTNQTTLRLFIPFCKPISASGFTVTSIDNCYLRWNGGYVYYNSGSARTAINGVTFVADSVTATIYPQQGILISAVCTNKWYQSSSAELPNNSIVTMNGTITGQFN